MGIHYHPPCSPRPRKRGTLQGPVLYVDLHADYSDREDILIGDLPALNHFLGAG